MTATPYQRGYADYLLAKELRDNPYDDLTQLSQSEGWEEGWYDAYDDYEDLEH